MSIANDPPDIQKIMEALGAPECHTTSFVHAVAAAIALAVREQRSLQQKELAELLDFLDTYDFPCDTEFYLGQLRKDAIVHCANTMRHEEFVSTDKQYRRIAEALSATRRILRKILDAIGLHSPPLRISYKSIRRDPSYAIIYHLEDIQMALSEQRKACTNHEDAVQ